MEVDMTKTRKPPVPTAPTVAQKLRGAAEKFNWLLVQARDMGMEVDVSAGPKDEVVIEKITWAREF
jgi:hypothetical protein